MPRPQTDQEVHQETVKTATEITYHHEDETEMTDLTQGNSGKASLLSYLNVLEYVRHLCSLIYMCAREHINPFCTWMKNWFYNNAVELNDFL